jgi:hypothetical protein
MYSAGINAFSNWSGDMYGDSDQDSEWKLSGGKLNFDSHHSC